MIKYDVVSKICFVLISLGSLLSISHIKANENVTAPRNPPYPYKNRKNIMLILSRGKFNFSLPQLVVRVSLLL